jgi:hypothetical protein
MIRQKLRCLSHRRNWKKTEFITLRDPGMTGAKGSSSEPLPSLDFQERNSPHIMFTQRPSFSAISCTIRYPKWCSDSLIVRCLFASHRYDFPIIRTPAGRMTPRMVADQSAILANGKRQISESHESLGDSNVSGIPFRGVGAKIPSQMNPLRQPGVSTRASQAPGPRQAPQIVQQT